LPGSPKKCPAPYCIERLLQEAYGRQEMEFVGAAGLVLKSDYARFYDERGAELPPEGVRPYLLGIERSDPVTRLPGTTASVLFVRTRPRFHFSRAEQRVLQHAVMDLPDSEIADAIGVTADSVKKVWRRIQERVAAVAPEMVQDEPKRQGARGREKRSRIIAYVRHHPQELRPFRR
jgi:hypothetical protein